MGKKPQRTDVFKLEDGWELLTVTVRVGEPLDGGPWGATHRWSRGTSPVVWLMEGGREENTVPAWGVLTVLPSSSLEERSGVSSCTRKEI